MSKMPRISCIMPTNYKRRPFVEQAIRYFHQQDYPNKELLVIDEYDDAYGGVYALAYGVRHVRYVNIDTDVPLSIGAKRNLACSLAKGGIICHWDDDDIYRPNRLSRQAAPLIAGEADITGLTMDVVVNLNDFTAWRCTPTLHKEIFANDVHGGTLMYRTSLWNNRASFENKSTGEDGGFLRLVRSQGARLAKVENAGSFIYVRRESTWPLPPQGYQHEEEWEQVPLHTYLSEEERTFYACLKTEEVRV